MPVCINSSFLITPNSGAGLETNLQFRFPKYETTILYGVLELYKTADGMTQCFQDINQQRGIDIFTEVNSGTSENFVRFDNSNNLPATRFMEVKIPTDGPKRLPGFKIVRDGAFYYFIGIDDVRTGYAQAYFKFILDRRNTFANGGVNVRFENNCLYVKGGNQVDPRP